MTSILLGDKMNGMVLTGEWVLVGYENNKEVQIGSNQDWEGLEDRLEKYSTSEFSTFSGDKIYQTPEHESALSLCLDNFTLPMKGNDFFCVSVNQLIKGPLRSAVPSIDKLKFMYRAVVTEDATRGFNGNDNDCIIAAFLKDENSNDTTITSATGQETVYTYDINLLKYADGDTSKVLPGAQFALFKMSRTGEIRYYYKLMEDAPLIEGKDLAGPKVTWVDIGDKTINQAIADGDITAVTSGQDGKTAFTGIPHDKYYLQEVKAPEGYNLMAEDMLVELGADAPADFEVQVENTGGALLPETGGPGTALFTMMGLLLMAGAVTVYLTQRKHHQS